MKTRVSEIDLLRFLAAMMVVFFHYTFRGFAADGLSDLGFPEFAFISKYGFLGVDLFFMISGFVILMTASSGSLRRFTVSRIVRLYPAYLACCTVTFIAILTLGQDRFNATPIQYLINLTMLNEFFHVPSIDGVYWSLAVEIKFYLLVTSLLLARQIHLAQGYLVAWLAATLLLELVPVEAFRSILISRYAPDFILGSISYLAFSSGWTRTRIAAFGVGWILALNSALESSIQYGRHYHVHFEVGVVICLMSLFAVVMVLVSMRRLSLIARQDWTQVGALTYPLYLVHQNLGFMIFNSLGDSIERHALLAGTLVLMLWAAHVIHVWVERPTSARMALWLNRKPLASRA